MITRNEPIRMLTRFRRNECGSMTVFGLIVFVLMIMMGGMAVDLMRYEHTRVTLQQTLDRSTLAAAALSQTLDAEDVVQDYFEKAGLESQLDDVNVTQSVTTKSVVARGFAQSPSFFMQLMGINQMDVNAVSGAVQSTSNLEIVLVLDVSGSMSGSKIETLRTSANEFVDTMLENDPFGRVSIAVVPYNAQVNLGPDLRSKFQETHQHGVANINCLELPDEAYVTPAVPLTLDLPMMAYADLFGGTNYVDAAVSATDTTYTTPYFGYSFCRANTENIVRLPSQDRNTIKARISALTAGGNTSITLGMKWGMTLLDPTMRPAFGELGAEGVMSSDLADRPYDYTDGNVEKVVVLMTDGEHVSHERITDDYKTGPSPIYRNAAGEYSIFHSSVTGPDQYWVPHLGTWQSTPFDGGTQQDWKDIWATMKVSYVAWQFYARALGGADWNAEVDAFYAARNEMVARWKTSSEMNTMLQTTCNQARENNVTVYGIAFQAPVNGQTQIRNCSTDDSFYFDAGDGPKLRSAFRQIATNLTQLRLTQ